MTTAHPSALFPEFQAIAGLDAAGARDYPYAELAIAIARLRGQYGLTQTEFAQRIGTTQSVVARVESGRHGVQISLLNRIADAFSTDWNLTFGEPQTAEAQAAATNRLPTSGDTLVDAFNEVNLAHDFDAAHRLANKIRRQPGTPRRKLVLALDAFNQGKHALAIRWSRAALEGDLPTPSREVASIVLGRSLLATNQPAAALEALTGAGTTWTAKAARAEALMDSENHTEAIVLAEQLMAEADGEEIPAAAFLAARVHWHADRPLQALERIGAFRSHRPADREGILLHGAILGHLGDLHSDSACHEAALRLFESIPSDSEPEVLRLIAMTAARLGRWRDALNAASHACRLAPGTDYDRSAAAIARDCFADIKKTNEILDAADLAEDLRLLTADELKSFRALGHALRGDFDAALASLALPDQKLELAAPEDQIRCAMAHLVRGNLQLAYPILRDNAAALSNPDGQLQLARSALAAGDPAGARAALRRVADSDGAAGRTALVALDLLKAIEDAGAVGVLARLNLFPDPLSQRVLPPSELGPAPESVWEGPEGNLGRPTHLGASLVLNHAARERMTAALVH